MELSNEVGKEEQLNKLSQAARPFAELPPKSLLGKPGPRENLLVLLSPLLWTLRSHAGTSRPPWLSINAQINQQ